MPRRSPVDAVVAGVVTTLASSTGITASVYNNVPQGEAYPYIVVTSPTDRRIDTMGRFGSSVLIDVRVVSQYRGDHEAAGILDRCIQALNFQKPTLTGHTTLGITWEQSDRYQELVNGIPTRHHVGTFRVWAEQSSS